ncbi:MAG: hypothetical protein IKH45_00620 [Neisseriaceae bacterium]|nr:hypothetical protein [Neisseriaceae bacterium]MBR4625900.1 hypothetical protein [Alphaproteobacteria bacterium]
MYQKQGEVNVLDKRKAQIRNHASYPRQIQYISLKRRPFNGEFCECWQVLLKNGETWNFYHNQRHRVYQKIIL